MSKLSFIEKVKILIEISKSSKLFIVLLIILLFLGIGLINTNKRNEKLNKIILSIVIIMTIG